MAVLPNSKKTYLGYMKPFYLEPQKKDVMGYRLTNVDSGVTIMPGTPIVANDANKTAVVCKYGVITGVTSTGSNAGKEFTVRPGHLFKAGEKIAVSGAETLVALTISSVSGDTIVLSAAPATALKAGDIVLEVKSTTTGSGQSAVTTVSAAGVPNRIVDAVAQMDDLHKDVSACHSGVVLKNVVKYPSEYINASTFPGSEYLIGCGGILFITQ